MEGNQKQKGGIGDRRGSRGVGLSLGACTPRILTVFSKMIRLLAPFTFIPTREISSLMGTTTNSTLQG